MDWVELIREEITDLDRRARPYDMGEQQLDDELLNLFDQTLTETTSSLLRAYRSGDDKGVAGAAHSIKGMGGMAGCPEISALAEEIEKRIESGDRAGVDRLVSVLQQCLELGVGRR